MPLVHRLNLITPSHLYSDVHRCPLSSDDALASAAIFRRRRAIPPGASLGATPPLSCRSHPPRNHAHETGDATRRDGEPVAVFFLPCYLEPAGARSELKVESGGRRFFFGACVRRGGGIARRRDGIHLRASFSGARARRPGRPARPAGRGRGANGFRVCILLFLKQKIPSTCDSLMAGRFSFGFWCWWALANLARCGRVYV